jgi:hypothetical protein
LDVLGTPIGARKGPYIFFEKEWSSVNSTLYDTHVLSLIERYREQYPSSIFMQDNAPSHRSLETRTNLLKRHIHRIPWPRYSPDLNLIEHVWNWMKNWIEQHYWGAIYHASKFILAQLRQIILEAWDAVPDSFIENLYNSWWERCQAVINANGGPTRY